MPLDIRSEEVNRLAETSAALAGFAILAIEEADAALSVRLDGVERPAASALAICALTCAYLPRDASLGRRSSRSGRRDPPIHDLDHIGPPFEVAEQCRVGPRHPDLALQGFESIEEARPPARIEMGRDLVEEDHGR
jgi:hypothetical protein